MTDHSVPYGKYRALQMEVEELRRKNTGLHGQLHAALRKLDQLQDEIAMTNQQIHAKARRASWGDLQ